MRSQHQDMMLNWAIQFLVWSFRQPCQFKFIVFSLFARAWNTDLDARPVCKICIPAKGPFVIRPFKPPVRQTPYDLLASITGRRISPDIGNARVPPRAFDLFPALPTELRDVVWDMAYLNYLKGTRFYELTHPRCFTAEIHPWPSWSVVWRTCLLHSSEWAIHMQGLRDLLAASSDSRARGIFLASVDDSRGAPKPFDSMLEFFYLVKDGRPGPEPVLPVRVPFHSGKIFCFYVPHLVTGSGDRFPRVLKNDNSINSIFRQVRRIGIMVHRRLTHELLHSIDYHFQLTPRADDNHQRMGEFLKRFDRLHEITLYNCGPIANGLPPPGSDFHIFLSRRIVIRPFGPGPEVHFITDW